MEELYLDPVSMDGVISLPADREPVMTKPKQKKSSQGCELFVYSTVIKQTKYISGLSEELIFYIKIPLKGSMGKYQGLPAMRK